MTTPLTQTWSPWWKCALLRLDRTPVVLRFLGFWLVVGVLMQAVQGTLALLVAFFTFLVGVLAHAALRNWAKATRERHVREWPLPERLRHQLREQYPHLQLRDAILVERALRQFFLACLRSGGQTVSMPSKVVDTLWHDFILDTRAYARWCAGTLGHFLHHEPATKLGHDAALNDSLRRAWYWACKEESISPRQPSRLPLLFALDSKLDIPNGFRYTLGAGIAASLAAGAAAAAAQPISDLTGSGPSGDGSPYAGSASDFGGADPSTSGGGGDFGGGGAEGGSCGGSCGGGGGGD